MPIEIDRPHILVTGGAGFVGAHLAVRLKQSFPSVQVVAFDNLKRRGSETNITRLALAGVEFRHGDVRNPSDLADVFPVGLIIECSAEPSVLSGYDGAPGYVIDTNLVGALNCLEHARRTGAGFIFLSTSRVYPIHALESLAIEEAPSRFVLADYQALQGASKHGISVDFPLEGVRSIYGATKLAAEIIAREYGDAFGIPIIANRCGVIAGPGQFGKADQGIFSHWMMAHYFKKPLSYIGYGGSGKQVRDLLHVDDLADLIIKQAENLRSLSGSVFNAGGGSDYSLSLREATEICQSITGNEMPIAHVTDIRRADVPVYITDNRKVTEATGWTPVRPPSQVLRDMYDWLRDNENQLSFLLH